MVPGGLLCRPCAVAPVQALTGVLALSALVVAAEPPRVAITVHADRSRGAVSPYVFGAGIDHKTNPMRFCRHPEQVARDIAESHLRLARYPGGFVYARDDHRGSWKNFYWQDHIGRNPDGRPFYTYDLDTFLQMCERFAIEPLMQINIMGETDASIRGYIEYLTGAGDRDGDGVDWAAVRRRNGRQEPYRVRFWQLGNELHDPPQGFGGSAEDARDYAAAVERLAPMIRGMVPEARIVVPLINIERPRSGMARPEAAPGKPDINLASSAEFARAFLSHLRVPVDYVDWHFYAANGWNGDYPYLGTDDEWRHYYTWGTKFRECYEAVVSLLEESCQQRPLPRLVVGEWSGDWTGDIFRDHPRSYRGSMMRTMASAVYMADILLFLMDRSGPDGHVAAACWHNFANGAQEMFSIQATEEYARVLGAGRTWKGAITDEGYGVRMPLYWVFSLLSRTCGDDLLETRLEAPDNRIRAPSPGLYTDPEYAFDRVTCCATRRGAELSLAVVNKDAHQAVDLRVAVRGWALDSAATAESVGAESYLAENSMADPKRVSPREPERVAVTAGGEVRLVLPPNTVMVLRCRRAGD